MSFPLPPQGSAAREMMGEVSAIAEILAPQNVSKLPVTWQAKKQAAAMFAASKAVKRVCFVVLRAESDERWLISIGPRGGWRKEWNFGTGRTQ